ncbi:hypothetical protein DFH07DRAFT_770301 [Mycena maculata]|uniref:Uncharacterized protein n=1 Tax=Mycena maculata TaxID=230809 RepID=A0AAD7NL88_9AGAR|nr:hypothetical protein DFH07DRAFT_770301 [Mycena maculata]
MYAMDLDPGDRESDWEDASDEEDRDPDYDREDDPMTGLPEEDYPPVRNFVQSATLLCSAVIPKALPRNSLNHRLDCSELTDRWIRNINVFFWPLVNPLARQTSQYRTERFQKALKMSGLLDKLHQICKPGNLLETSHLDVELSFRFHNWKISYVEKICDWTPEVLTKTEYEVRIFGWNSEIVFRTLKRLELFTNANVPNSKAFLKRLQDRKLATVIQETWAHRQILKRVKRYAWRPQWSSPANDSEPPSSSTATASTSTVKPSLSMTSAARRHRKQREDNRRVWTNEAREEEREERQLKDLQELAERGTELELGAAAALPSVKRQPNAKQFIGAAFTCAPVGDQLMPVPVRRCKTSKGPIKKMPPLRYINPESLEGVEAVLVGGVRYEAFKPTILQWLIDNHRRVKSFGAEPNMQDTDVLIEVGSTIALSM